MSASFRPKSSRFASSSRRRTRQNRLRLESLEARRLLTAELEPNDTFLSANPITFITDLTGVDEGTLEGQTQSASDLDHFQFDLGPGQRFELFVGIPGSPPNFNPTLPPGVEIFREDGVLVATSDDGGDIDLVTGVGATFIVRLRTDSAFGLVRGSYQFSANIYPSNVGVTPFIPEPNNRVATAKSKPANLPLFDSIASATDVDFYRVNGDVGDMISITFVGSPSDQPSVAVETADGTQLALDTTGDGLRYIMTSDDTHYIRRTGCLLWHTVRF